jgi:multiple sugar transport system ATP-binding protein
VATITLDHVTKRFHSRVAVNDFTFHVDDGEFFCILGPAGAGKSTTLRLIAGLTQPTSGDVLIDGRSVRKVHTSQRDLAMIFDNLALYPNRTGFENVAFPLRVAGRPEVEIKRRVLEVAELLRIEHVLHRLPGTFSGGERQRIALARALVRQPQAFLLDEPLSSLDALLRNNMRAELRRLQRDVGRTMIMATPDYVEALALADRIVVIREGAVQQLGARDDVYFRPANTFVATLVGNPAINLFEGRLSREDGVLYFDAGPGVRVNLGASRWEERALAGGTVVLGIRPEDTQLGDGDIAARIVAIEPQGSRAVVDLEIGERVMRAIVKDYEQFSVGSTVAMVWPSEKILLFEGLHGTRIAETAAARAGGPDEEP